MRFGTVLIDFSSAYVIFATLLPLDPPKKKKAVDQFIGGCNARNSSVMSHSTKAIELGIEKLSLKNSKIDEESTVQLATDLKNNLLHNTDDSTRALILLARLLNSPISSGLLVQVFNEQLIDVIFKQITPNSTLDVVNSSLSVLGSIVKGSIFGSTPPSQYAIPILNSTNTNLKVLEIISNKLCLENLDLMLNSASFINGYLGLDHVELNSINHLAEFILHLQKSEFFVTLANISQTDKFKKPLEESLKRAQVVFQKNVNLLSELKVDLNSKYQHEVLNIILSQTTKADTKSEKNLILERFSVFHLIDLYFFLESTNITFKKEYHQQVLFNNNKQKFPLPLCSLSVSNLLTSIYDVNSETHSYKSIHKYFYLRDLLQYNLISKLLEFWVESKAEREDFENLFALVKLLLKELDESLDPEVELNIVEKIRTVFQRMTYKEIRSIQLEGIKAHVANSSKEETLKFNKVLNDQIFEFVKNQKFRSLAQGAWVYSQVPSAQSTDTNNGHCFIILSPNFKQLLYKDFKPPRPEGKPDIDKSGSSIDISSITSFAVEEILQVDKNAPPASNSKLINLIDKTIINKISLINRKNKTLFSFYAKKDESLVWLDGLNLLMGHYDNLSKELRQHLAKLYNVRRTVQLLNCDTSRDDVEIYK